MFREARDSVRIVGFLAAVASCLPADDRPPPGSFLVTVSPGPAVQGGTVTADGWNISFGRVLIDVGRISFGGSSCVQYSDARYDRVVDVTQGTGQKLSQEFGLGQCENLSFRVSTPSSDAVLGVGVTDADTTLMRTPGSDAYTPSGGISLIVQGVATNGSMSKTFDWQFRTRLRYDNCSVTIDGQPEPGVTLAANDSFVFDIRIDAERLFRDDMKDSTAVLRFAPFADADSIYGNNDGVVDLDELSAVSLSMAQGYGGPYGLQPDLVDADAGDAEESGAVDAADDADVSIEMDSASDAADGADSSAQDDGATTDAADTDASADDSGSTDGGPPLIQTLEDYVYLAQFPTLPRYRDTGSCTVSVNTN